MIVNASETTTWRVLAPFLVRLQRARARRSVIAQNGDPGRAATILGQQRARFAGRDADGYFWHPAWLALGDTAQALTALDEGARQGLVGVNLVLRVYDPVRASPRFAALVRKLGLDVALFTSPNGGRPR